MVRIEDRDADDTIKAPSFKTRESLYTNNAASLVRVGLLLLTS